VDVDVDVGVGVGLDLGTRVWGVFVESSSSGGISIS